MSWYVLIVVLQVFCIVHLLRKGGSWGWILFIIFMPIIGSLVYLVYHFFPISKVQTGDVQSGLEELVKPGSKIEKLQKQLDFSDSFDNKVALADALLAAGRFDEAIELYEDCQDGIFSDNQYVAMQIIKAYFEVERYEDLLHVVNTIAERKELERSPAHLLYAKALERLGELSKAREEFASMVVRFANFDARIDFAQFLLRQNDTNEARQVLQAILEEGEHMTGREKREKRPAINRAKAALDQLGG